MLRSRLNILLASCLGLYCLCACQAPAYKSFESIKVGMDKSIVVESVGSPTKTRRWHGKDRWIYEFGDHPGGTLVREVLFDGGFVVYAGPKQNPGVTAEQQDKVNEAAVIEDSKRASEAADLRDQLVGAHRVKRGYEQEPEDEDDIKIRQSFYGIEPNPQAMRSKRAPHFEPIQ